MAEQADPSSEHKQRLLKLQAAFEQRLMAEAFEKNHAKPTLDP